MDLLAELTTEYGDAPPPPPPAQDTATIKETAELVRIRSLPRRDWDKDPTLDALIAGLNKWLQHTPAKCTPKPCSCCKYVSGLKKSQAVALKDAYALKHGCVLPFRVGGGKTLLSLLLGTVIGARKVLLIVPGEGDLKDKTLREMRDYAKHWRCSVREVVTYEFLANPRNKEWIAKFAPDCIICDESQKLKKASSKAAKRIGRYLKSCYETGRIPGELWPGGLTPWRGCAFFPLSGSMSGRKLDEYWHYTRWAMRSHAPLPKDPFEVMLWGKATDEKISEDERPDPGPLLTLGRYDPEADPVTQARQAFKDRFLSTPGVVSTLEDVPSVGLVMKATQLHLPPAVLEPLKVLRETRFTPTGEYVKEAWDLWKHSRSMGCGLFYRWDPPAPFEWKLARREWWEFVRDTERRFSQRFDSEVHIREAVLAGELDDGGRWATWSEIEPTFVPNPVSVFLDDTALKYCADWLHDPDNLHGIVWTEYAPFGEALSAMSGVPYFSMQGRNPEGVRLDQYKGGPAIASFACSKGQNLQGMSGWHFCKNLFSSVPPLNARLEQAIGRTHRDGQVEDEVTVEFLLTTRESYRCMNQCFRDARRNEEMDGQPQKLCYGEVHCSLLEQIREQEIDLESAGY